MANKQRSIFVSAIAGNILEYYDFTVYAVFVLAIGHTFFPAISEINQVLSSLAVFATGFITRPIGGILFGYIGDHFGRRVSLITSVLGMTISTFTIGLIPGYDTIGYFAPIILVMMRLIQGLCISGEGAGAAIFVLEHFHHLRPGLVTGLVHGSNIAGTLIAIATGLFINSYFTNIDFAWRFAFVIGGFLGMAGFYLRLRVAETPIFIQLAEKKRTLKAPFFHVVQTAWRLMFLTFCVGGVTSSVVYLVKTYVNVFYSDIMHFDSNTSLLYFLYASFVLMIFMPLFSALTDYFGRVKVIVASAIFIIVGSIPVMLFMSSEIIWQQLLALSFLSILAASISGPAYIFVISLFTPEERFTGVAFSYNLGIAVFGGTSPIISRYLVNVTEVYYAPAFYIMSVASIFLMILYVMRGYIRDRD